MFFKKPGQPARYGCLRGSAVGIECGPTQWWFLPDPDAGEIRSRPGVPRDLIVEIVRRWG